MPLPTETGYATSDMDVQFAVGTKFFPYLRFIGNYLRHTHRLTITNFDSIEEPWTLLAKQCAEYQVRTTMTGSRYLFERRLP